MILSFDYNFLDIIVEKENIIYVYMVFEELV